jgi:hypothetical protein
MKQVLEIMAEGCAGAAALLWFASAKIRLKQHGLARHGLGIGAADPKALMALIYRQSIWSAWAAMASGFAALFAMLDGILPIT